MRYDRGRILVSRDTTPLQRPRRVNSCVRQCQTEVADDQRRILRRLREYPLDFPAVDGVIPPADWVAEAWNVEDIREANLGDWQREVSKTGELNCRDEVLRVLSQLPGAITELYDRLRDSSPHREAEFRPQFERALDARILPRPLSRLRLVRKLGMETAEVLLADGFTCPAERAMFLKVMPQVCGLFNEVDPPGFDPPTDDEYDEVVERVAAGLPGRRSRDELRILIRDSFLTRWMYWSQSPPGAEAELKFDRLADEVWRLWCDVKQDESRG